MRWAWKFVIYLSILKNNIFIYNKFYIFRHKKYGKARSRTMLTGTGLAVQSLPARDKTIRSGNRKDLMESDQLRRIILFQHVDGPLRAHG